MTVEEHQTPAARRYLDDVSALLASAIEEERPAMGRAATIISERFSRDGLLYVFGSGHSHIFAEEAFFRAGGSARVCPILQPEHMLHVSADRSTQLERKTGLAKDLLAHYAINPQRDALLVVSNSGVNALPVEVATSAKDMGVPLLAITSVAYANSKPVDGLRLHDVADVTVDNHCPPGDALVELGESFPSMGPGSSVIGLALLNAILVDSLARGWHAGEQPEVLLSAGMPDAADRNRALIEKFRPRVPHI